MMLIPITDQLTFPSEPRNVQESIVLDPVACVLIFFKTGHADPCRVCGGVSRFRGQLLISSPVALPGSFPRMAKISEHLSERKIDASGTCQRVLPVLKRSDAVIDEACGPPHTAMSLFPKYRRRTGSERRLPPQKEYNGQAQRDSHDFAVEEGHSAEVALVIRAGAADQRGLNAAG
jgi:hypothetical protein